MQRPADGSSELSFLDKFSNSVMQAELAVPQGVVGPDGKKSEKRFSVYRNNVASSLTEAMAANFPVVQRLLGDDFFAALARVFIGKHPPKIPMLFLYGNKFAGFLEQFEPVAKYPFLADVARTEYAWLQSYHAADEATLGGEELGAVAPEKISDVRFTSHPATWIFHSDWPVLTIIARNREGGDCSDIDLSIGEDILVTRPALDVEMRILPAGGFAFLSALDNGSTLGEAAGIAVEADAGFDLSMQITGMLESGVFCAISTE